MEKSIKVIDDFRFGFIILNRRDKVVCTARGWGKGMYFLSSRQTIFMTKKGNELRVGQSAIANSLFILNGIIPLSWLNKEVAI